MTDTGPVLRIFEVHAKADCAEALVENFATTSAGVVQGQPGNVGYFFGRCVQGGGDQGSENVVMFVSVWASLEAVKARFGDDWQTSYMPDCYEDLIDACAVRHFDMSAGWHVNCL